MTEIWKQIDGFKDYQVSNFGNVKSSKKNRERILKPFKDKRGYSCVRLYENKERKHFFVHRLVASMFICNPDNKTQVNHIDGNKNNNRLDNLEWVTNDENMRHSWDIGLRKPPMKGKFGKEHNKSKPVLQILDGEVIAEYSNAREAEKITNIANPNISACCNKKYKTAGGFVWRFKEEYNKCQ